MKLVSVEMVMVFDQSILIKGVNHFRDLVSGVCSMIVFQLQEDDKGAEKVHHPQTPQCSDHPAKEVHLYVRVV